MKKKVILIILLLTIPFALSGTVTLNSPENNNLTNTTTIIFSCTALDPSLTITSIALHTNSSGTMSQVAIDSSGSSTVSFTQTLAPKSYLWNCLATFSDASTATASDHTLTIHSLNFAGTIPTQTITEDSSSNAFDLDSYFTNALRYTVSGNNSINLTISPDNQVSITPTANFSGTQNITITGYYNTASVTSNLFLVNITQVNDAPYLIKNISNQTTKKNTSFSIDISQYFSDIDSSLNYTINSTTFSVNKTSSLLTITPISTFTGSKEVTITATDGSLTTTSNSFTISITSTGNSAPTIDFYSPDSNPILEIASTQNFSITASDADGDTLTYAWALDSETVSTSTSYSYIAEEEGTYTLTATVSDNESSTSKSWTIIVGSPLIEQPNVESILTQTTNNTVCGNGIAEKGETCSSCSLDVICSNNTICVNGTCQQKQSATKAILILALITIGVIIIGILIYYFTSVKPSSNKPQQFQYRPSSIKPPSDYTDFYKKK